MSLVLTFFFLLCSIVIAVFVHAKPFYSLPGPYHFDGKPSNFVLLTDLVCVKGNAALSIQFQMRTSTLPPKDSFRTLIGTIMTSAYSHAH